MNENPISDIARTTMMKIVAEVEVRLKDFMDRNQIPLNEFWKDATSIETEIENGRRCEYYWKGILVCTSEWSIKDKNITINVK